MKSFVVYENGAFVCMARVDTVQGVLLTKAKFVGSGSIVTKVYDTTTNSQVGASVTEVVADVVFDTLQTDSRWTEDEEGYNVAVIISPDKVPSGRRFYEVQAYITPNDGYAFPIIWRVQTENTYH